MTPAPPPTTRPDLTTLGAPVAQQMAAVERGLHDLVPEAVGGVVPAVYHQLLDSGGKRLRPLLTLLSCQAAGGEVERAVALATSVEVLHLASLVHDDVIDEADERRGKPSARTQWGNRASILVGDFLVATVFRSTAGALGRQGLSILAEAVTEMCQAELCYHADCRTLSEEEYLRNLQGKTGALMGAACEVGAVAAENEAAAPVLRDFGRRLGEAFQLADDLLDLYGDADVIGKPVLQDLQHGHWTLAVHHALGLADDAQEAALRAALEAAEGNREAAQEAALLVEQIGGRRHAQQFANDLVAQAEASLTSLSPSPARESLAGLAHYVLTRRL